MRKIRLNDDIKFKELFKKLRIANTFSVILISLLIGIVLRFYVFEVVKVDGLSMFPTFNNKQYLVVLKNFYNIDKEDIVIFKSHDVNENIYVKRVIGLPNDHVVIKDNKVYINNEEIKEEYLPAYTNTIGDVDLIVPENEYFLMGDNRSQSKDSRIIGTIKKEDIIGEITSKLF